MNTLKNKLSFIKSRMSLRLWAIMMILVVFTVGSMWVVQIVFLERNYVNTVIADVESRINPILKSLETEDLKTNDELIPYLSRYIEGKILLINSKGELIEMYSYGYPVDLDQNSTDSNMWLAIKNSPSYSNISQGQPYSNSITANNRLIAYEAGMPAHYDGDGAYILLYRHFDELYDVLDINRQQLIIITVFLTSIAALLAIILVRLFIKPILTIKDSVDRLSEGDLDISADLGLNDELGDLSHSVDKLALALKRVEVLRKEIIANVSHELRSPLALIGGYAEMVRDITWQDETKRNEDLNLIIAESNRMSEMVKDVLEYSQLQSGYIQLHRGYCNLYDIVVEEVDHCLQSSRDYKIDIAIKTTSNQIDVLVDEIKIHQVIRNLLANAINHTDDGKTIEVSIDQVSEKIKLSIANPGALIPLEERELIWERYQRFQHQGSRKQGSGIGLSIVSTILDAHSMEYGVDCDAGKVIFWFVLT